MRCKHLAEIQGGFFCPVYVEVKSTVVAVRCHIDPYFLYFLGKIVINGEELEGTYDVGSNTKLALSGREVYGSAEEGNEATE